MIPDDIVKRIKDAARLEDVVPDPRPSGKDLYTKCPSCGYIDRRKRKGLIITPTKQIAKCFKCGWSAKGAINYLMDAKGEQYPDALRILANQYGISLPEAEEAKMEVKKKAKQNGSHKSFFEQQLESSGLTADDIQAKVKCDDNTTKERLPFIAGTRDMYGRILPLEGDDMLIYYFDLEGKEVLYKSKQGKFLPLVRVRWQNPYAHKDKEGRPIKYQSPSGSGSHLYIPEKIRDLYKRGRKIDTLYIQEGEKKAEKCCKHGIYSVGIMGIQNLGYDKQLPEEIQLIIQKCQVDNVMFMLDADWADLSGSLKNGDRVDQRPLSFFYAVKNFKEYMRTLVNLGISVEIWFGHIRDNEKGDKGIDDLLANSLKGNEKSLKEDINKAMHEKEGEGSLVQVHKITTINDQKLADLWHLNDAEKFVKVHFDELKELKEFVLNRIKRRLTEEGKLELAQPLMDDEQYWEEKTRQTRSGFENTELSFNYVRCFRFLQNRGYGRIRTKAGTFQFAHIDNRVVQNVDQYDIKDYVTWFTKELKREDVLNMIYKGGPQYLGQEKLSNLEYLNPIIERSTQTTQCLYFKDKIWEISAEGIKELQYSNLKSFVWEDKLISADVSIMDPLVQVHQITEGDLAKLGKEYQNIPAGEFSIDITKEGRKTDFLQFLVNTSSFRYSDEDDTDPLIRDIETNRHILNKLTAIGYLLHEYKNVSEAKAVIGMDGKISEVGASEGRTGKSLLGYALEQVIPVEYIGAKNKKITEDQFLFSEVTEKTAVIFLDDVRANVDFEFFFPIITGKLKVNVKGGLRFTLDVDETPKLYMTTNHAINGEDGSFRDRQAYVVFSDHYSDKHKPVDDFGHNFFTEWGHDQWNRFYNLMATCLHLYFRSIAEGWAGKGMGIVEPPMENVELRRLRQMIGEDFLTWADPLYTKSLTGDPGESKLNRREVRKELYDNFLENNPHARKYTTATGFGKKVKYYCKYRGLHFNPNKPNRQGIDFAEFRRDHPDKLFVGEIDKASSKEYFTLGDNDYTNTF